MAFQLAAEQPNRQYTLDDYTRLQEFVHLAKTDCEKADQEVASINAKTEKSTTLLDAKRFALAEIEKWKNLPPLNALAIQLFDILRKQDGQSPSPTTLVVAVNSKLHRQVVSKATTIHRPQAARQ